MELVIPFVALLAIPLIMLLVMNSHAGIMFFAACTGLILLSSLDSTVVVAAAALVPTEGEAYVRLAVVMLTIVFAGLVFRNTTAGSIVALHVLIILIMTIVLLMVLPGVTGLSWLEDMTKNKVWQDVNEFRSLIIGTGFGLSLLSLTTMVSHHKRSKKK